MRGPLIHLTDGEDLVLKVILECSVLAMPWKAMRRTRIERGIIQLKYLSSTISHIHDGVASLSTPDSGF